MTAFMECQALTQTWKFWKWEILEGPVWLIMNYMILVGLENEEEYLLAKRIKDDTIKLTDVGGMFEYFDPFTGKGLGGDNFSWTAAIFLNCVEKVMILDI